MRPTPSPLSSLTSRRAWAVALLAPLALVPVIAACNEAASAAPTAPAASANASVAQAPGAGAGKAPGGGSGGGTSGIVTAITATGLGANPTPSLAFIAPTASVTLASSQLLFVSSQKSLGSTYAVGGVSLQIGVCYRAAGGNLVTAGAEIPGLRVSGGTRAVWTLSAAITLPAGTYDVGLCGSTPDYVHWNDNGYGRTTVLVFPAG